MSSASSASNSGRMRVHVVGSGGREHALRTVLARTATIINDPDEADLIVVGPEAPLIAGIADKYRAKGKLVFGPGAAGAQLEKSKSWMKDFVGRAGVPTARYGSFDTVDGAFAFLRSLKPPYVIKTDGLASGKGVLVTDSLSQAAQDVQDKLSGASFGESGRRVVIEEGLTGPELSLFVIFDGTTGVALPVAQDFKRVGDGDTGPNTGGMGAYCDVPIATPAIVAEALERIVAPTCDLLQSEGIDYRGVLYAGLILTPDGVKLIEYNVRFGDPEAQVVIPRFGGDLAATLASAAAGKLQVDGPVAVPDQAVTITVTPAGYPTSSSCSGDVVIGIEDAESVEGVSVFLAGVDRDEQGRLITTGGRTLNVTALAPTLAQARNRAYEAVSRIHFDGMHYRSDIALKASLAATS